CDVQHIVGAWRGRDAEPALDGAEQTAAAGVIGVLAQHLDAAGHEPVPQQVRIRTRRLLHHARRFRQQLRLAGGFPFAQALRCQTREEPLGHLVHNMTCRASSREATAAISARRERSSTPWALRTTRRRTPAATALWMACGSSSSPREEGVSARQKSKIEGGK